jgi:hypothetical protein
LRRPRSAATAEDTPIDPAGRRDLIARRDAPERAHSSTDVVGDSRDAVDPRPNAVEPPPDGIDPRPDRASERADEASRRGTELRSKLRSYDATVRMGGDEFVCTFSNTSLAAAGRRMQEIKTVLASERPHGSISCGLAELAPQETLESLTARSDAALYRVKQRI